MVDTFLFGPDIQIIDLKTGKLTRQGIILFQSLTELGPQVNTNQSDLASHVAQNATDTTRGHVLQGLAVSNASSSTVSVDSPDATNDATNLTLSNEIKGDVNQLVTDLNAVITTLNGLLSQLRAAGVIET